MKKFINQVDTLLEQSLAGFCAAHQDIIVLGAGGKFIQRRQLQPSKVALVSGGGSGHEPLHAGFVGYGMLDAACPGQMFTAPTPDQILAATTAVDGGAGALYIVKNYDGDVMNFEMATEMASGQVMCVLVNDDVAVDNSTFSTGRRGVAGTLVVEKILGAAAERGMDLASLKALGNRVVGVTRSMGVALSSCTVPAVGTPTFELAEGEIEMGVGIHGEPGCRRELWRPAEVLVEEMLDVIFQDVGNMEGNEVLLLVNGFGATPIMELYLMYHLSQLQLQARGITVVRSLVGNYVTSLDMAGCSLTLSFLEADMLDHWDAPVHTAALRAGM